MKADKTKITIQVRGGCVCSVSSNSPDVAVTFLDWDNIMEQDAPSEAAIKFAEDKVNSETPHEIAF